MTQGAAPYVDIRDGNWPASHWLHALSVALSGPGFEGWRRFDLLLLLPALLGGATLARQVWGRDAALWFVLLYPWLYITSGAWFAGQRDIVAGHFLLGSLAAHWALLHGGRPALAAVAGAGLTAATLVKPTFAIFAPVIALHAAALAGLGRIAWAEAARGVLRIAFWSVAVLVAAALLLLAQGGTAAAFWEHAVLAIVVRIPETALPASVSLYALGRAVGGAWHWIALGAAATTLLAWRGGASRARAGVLLGWLFVAGGLVSLLVQGHALTYYLGPIFTGLVWLLCGALGQASRRLARPGPLRIVAGLGIALALAGTAVKVRHAYGPLWPVLRGEAPRSEWERRFPAGDELTAAEARVLAEQLRPFLPAGSTLLVWGRANVLNLLVARPQPTGFYHKPHVQRGVLPARFLEPWTREIVEDLTTRPPAAVVIDEEPRFARTPLRRFLEEMLAEGYRPIGGAGRVTLHVARDGRPTGATP